MKDLLKWITTNIVNLLNDMIKVIYPQNTKKLVLTNEGIDLGGGGMRHNAKVILSVWEDVWWFTHCFAHFETL